jgi:hypothetical protein
MPESTISPQSRNKNLATVQGKIGSAQGEVHERWASSRERSGPMKGKARTKEDKRPVQGKTVGQWVDGARVDNGPWASTRVGSGQGHMKAMV